MQNATLPPEELEKEKQVILREMDMNQDDPGQRASRRLFEVAYTKSPYRFTIIGYPDIFNQLQPADIRGYYTERYAPNNIFFVVAGDVQADEVIGRIQAAFAGAKHALRALAQSMARELGPEGIHVAHVVVDGAIDTSSCGEVYSRKALRSAELPA